MAAASDDDELAQLGYAPELRRRMGGFASFALSFSVISILTGALALYGYGLSYGGPFQMTVGWPLVSVMTLAVAAALGEMASAYPTAGALYHWASLLAGRGWGWLAAWLNLVGQIGLVAGVDYGLADLMATRLGYGDGRAVRLLIYALVLASHGLANHVGIEVVRRLSDVSAVYHLIVTALLAVALLWVPAHQPLSFLLHRFVVSGAALGGHPMWWSYAFVVGLLQAQWTLTGYDASAHAAEETVDARRAAPRGMVRSVLISGITGWVLLVLLTSTVSDLAATTSAKSGFLFALAHALPGSLGELFVWLVLGAMWFCGMSAVMSASRMLFAFAHDGGVDRRLARVSPRWGVPVATIWLCVVAALVLAVWADGYSVVVSISTVGLYGSYLIPIVALLWQRRQGKWPPTLFSLGRWAVLVELVAAAWIVFITVVFVLPPNEKVGLALALLLSALFVWWKVRAASRFTGPAHPGKSASGGHQ